MLAVSVITPSRSSRTASYRSRVIARVLAGSRVDRSPFVSLIVSSSPSVDLGILPNERHVPNPHGGYVAAIAEHPERARIQQEAHTQSSIPQLLCGDFFQQYRPHSDIEPLDFGHHPPGGQRRPRWERSMLIGGRDLDRGSAHASKKSSPGRKQG